MQILAVDLGADMVPVLGLGVEAPDSQVMPAAPATARSPVAPRASRARTDGSWGQESVPGHDLYRQATTACLTAIVLMQIVNVHLRRSSRASIVSRRLFGNVLITAGIAAELATILVIDCTPLGHAVSGTAPIGYQAWLPVCPVAVGMLLLEEALKALVRERQRGGGEISQAA